MIYKVYKKVGESNVQALTRFKKEGQIQEKLCFAGRLDPMAEGLLLALSGKEKKRAAEFCAMDKIYESEFLLGVSTDSGDILGVVKSGGANASGDCKLNFKQARETLNSFVGKVSWEYPCFSSKRVNGKALFEYALEGDCPKGRPTYKSEIYKIELLSLKKVDVEELQRAISDKLSCLRQSDLAWRYKDYRIEKVLKSWEGFFESNEKKSFQILTCRIFCAKSFYVRSLAEKFGEKLSVPSLALSIKRSAFGKYFKIFGKRGVFLKKY